MKNIIALVGILLVFATCKKNSSPPQPIPVIPSLTTSNASVVTRTNATIGGNITSNGGASITARGICYNTSPAPTTANSTIVSGSGTGDFSTTLINLTASTTYYVRAYATNNVGTAYGNEISFFTQAITTPTVITNTTVTTITPFTTTAVGNITDDGGTPITTRGTCWSTLQTPTIAGTKTIDGTGLGSFNSAINNLNANTTYYLRAYATNNQGTGYGDVITIATDVEGNVYSTVKIGTQTWMLENLKVTKLNDGTIIPNVTSNAIWNDFSSVITPMYCWYNNDINNKNLYGGIYNLLTVKTGTLSPIGWHVPTLYDIKTLIFYLDSSATNSVVTNSTGTQYTIPGLNNAGSKLKEAGFTHWPPPLGGSGNEGNNSSGFTALPGGWRQSIGGNFDYFGQNAGFWTSTPFEKYTNFDLILSFNDKDAIIIWDEDKQGFSVRCIKN